MKPRSFLTLSLGLCLAACNRGPADAVPADAQDRIACAMDGAARFERACSLDRMDSADGRILIVGRADAGYRRLLVTSDGRGVVSADGAEPASVTIVADGMIEVAVAGDRFRLPADTDGVP